MDYSFKNTSTLVYESRPKDFSQKVEVVACYMDGAKETLEKYYKLKERDDL